MLDVFWTVIFMGFGAVVVIVGGVIFIWTLLWMQNGGEDD